MRRMKKLLPAILAALLISTSASAAQYQFRDSAVASLTIPDEFSACTMDSCDEELEKILKNNKFTPEQWRSKVMTPSGYELYAMNIKDNKYIYLVYNESDEPETKKNDDGSITHRLMKDYKLIEEAEKKDDTLDELKKALARQGINADNIGHIEWIKTGGDYSLDYIEYLCYSGKEYFHCYETVYDAAKIELQFTSPTEFTEEEKAAHRAVLDKMQYSKRVDYTEVKEIINDNLQKKLEEETHSGENTKILRYAISASIAFVLIFSILMAIRSQKRKRKKYVITADKPSKRK